MTPAWHACHDTQRHWPPSHRVPPVQQSRSAGPVALVAQVASQQTGTVMLLMLPVLQPALDSSVDISLQSRMITLQTMPPSPAMFKSAHARGSHGRLLTVLLNLCRHACHLCASAQCGQRHHGLLEHRVQRGGTPSRRSSSAAIRSSSHATPWTRTALAEGAMARLLLRGGTVVALRSVLRSMIEARR